MKITNCNCGKLIECGCGTLSFDTYTNNTYSVLTVGNLVASGCTLDEYVIDWYVDDVLVLTTGKGIDTDIEAYHPLTGNASVPVPAGVYIPVVRYIVVDGVLVYVRKLKCKPYCNVIVELPDITVLSLNCGVSNITGDYQYTLLYQSIVPTDNPYRTIEWFLPDDQSVTHIAFEFLAYDIGDKIDVFYNNLGNSLASWITGYGDVTTNFNVSPMRYKPIASLYGVRFVVTLPGSYTSADKLIIKITPSINTPANKSTDWRINIKCLNTTFLCDYLQTSRRQYNVLGYSFQDFTVGNGCYTRLTIPLTTAFPPMNYPNDYGNFKYAMRPTSQLSGYGEWHIVDNNYTSVSLYFPRGTSYQTEYYYIPLYSTRQPADGTITISKTTGTLTFTFSSQQDYLDTLSNYQTAMASDWATSWVNDPTDIAYYKVFSFTMKDRPADCGDRISTTYTTRIPIWANVVFDDTGGVYTTTITFNTITNQFPYVDCDLTYTGVTALVDAVNAFHAAVYSLTTQCYEQPLFGQGYGLLGPFYSDQNKYSGGRGYALQGYSQDCIAQFTGVYTSSSQFIWYLFHFHLVITDMANPAQGFSLYNNLNPATNLGYSPATEAEENLLLRVTNGVVVYPNT